MQCSHCKKSLLELSKRIFVCETCSDDISAGDALLWCKKCHEETEHEHKRTKLKPGHNETKTDEVEGQETTRYLDNLFEDYHNLDCEDVIGGGTIKTRFGYQKVTKDDFGLTEEEILLMDDKALNQIVSIKHYRPFRHGALGADQPEQAHYDKKNR